MSMTLRMTDEEDRALDLLAAAEQVSKREAAVRAILHRAREVTRDQQVREMTRQVMSQDRDLLERLAQ